MKTRILLPAALALFAAQGVMAQRFTDDLGRGLVALKTDAGVFCSWRINAKEWENTEYNIYRGSTKLNESPLKVSNFMDKSGTVGASYTVRPVVNGVEKDACAAVKAWEKNYTVITPKHKAPITIPLEPNDATVADVDGDGELEILMKYCNFPETFNGGDNGIFTVVECLEMDGTVKWWINMGPNMGDFQNNEINIAAYDWDCDGKAEVVFRAADATVIHMADGKTYTVGDGSINYREGTEYPGGQWFLHYGKEYLVYADGETGRPFECIDFPLKRVEDENNPKGLLSGGEYDGLVSNEWGDGYGHRSSKYFFAAPYLDGRRPSLFLARGIYTKHKMIAYDIDAANHKLVERWRWNDIGGDWFGQGYHNMGIADVDWDGRDEIVYGSMVIDDNGYGLSTTGLGHGDSQHCGDLDPYSHGQEIFACLEHHPNNNFRNATTSKIYYRSVGDRDDGRCNAGNFVDSIPGSEGMSAHSDDLMCGASHKASVGYSKPTVPGVTLNFRVFWDGDLCDETFDYSNGKNTPGAIYKPGRQGTLAILEGSKTNNDTKGTPCFQGDIIGDWREEYIMRDADNNIRIYTTDIPTKHRIYSLWYDHQYRNAMIWQMCGYNQTPHVSFALSEFEDITVPPAPITMTDRTEIANGGNIGASHNGKHVVVCATSDMTLTAAEGASPAILTVNTPTWVQGHNDNNNITSETFTHTISSGNFAGNMKLIKQGDGRLVMPSGKHTYSGKTDVWAGTLALNGELVNSPVWLNRFAVLEAENLKISKDLDANYASVLRPGSDTVAGSISAGNVTLGFGSIVELDIFSDLSADRINAGKLTIETKDWKNGPEYLQPVIKLTEHPAGDATTLPSGKYLIGEIAEIQGNVADIILLGIDDMKKNLVYEDGKLYIDLVAYEPGNKTWAGGEGDVWDLDNSESFVMNGSSEKSVFVPGDEITFDDTADGTNVVIAGKLKPSAVIFKNETKDYTLSGDGQIVGDAKLEKEGSGTLTVNNINAYTGGTYIRGGKLVAGVLANSIGTDLGALSDVNSRIYLNNNATLAVNATATLGQRITMQNGNAALEVPENLELTTSRGISAGGIGQSLVKKGKGTLRLGTGNTMSRLVIEEGKVYASEADGRVSVPSTVEFVNGSLYDPDNGNSYTTNSANFVVGEGNTGHLYMDSRCAYTGKLTGKGKLTVYACWIRHDLNGDWSGFEGELTAAYYNAGGDFKWNNSFGMPKATLNILPNVTFNAQDKNVKLGNLRGSGIYNGSGTLTVGNDEKTISFGGEFTGKPKIVKIGKCDWSLTSAMEEITNFTAREGTLSINASKSPYNSRYLTAPLLIEGNARMRGRGTVGDITVSGNGILEPGTFSGEHRYGPIFSSNVSVNPGATLSLYLRVAGKSNDCSYLSVTGSLMINGTVKVEMSSSYEPKAGDEFQLWKTSSFSGNPELILPELPAGLEWDATGLKNATGLLKVKASSGVQGIADDETVVCHVFDNLGICRGSFETAKASAKHDAKRKLNLESGIYIMRLSGKTNSETLKINIR